MNIRKSFGVLLVLFFSAGCTSPPANLLPPAEPTVTTAPTIAIPTVTPSPSPSPTPQPTSSPTPTLSPTPTPAVLLGAGDIALCGAEQTGDEQTAALILEQLEQYPHARVFTAGDNVQDAGRAVEYRNCFEPSWGQFKDRIRPSAGNHDYMTELGGPYYAYFGEAAGPAGLGYYSYDLGDWHLVALNSNCDEIACGPNSQQAQWLRADLEQSDRYCTLLYWHVPRFSSGLTGGLGSVNTFWKLANEFGAEIVVNGHDHNYERFAPVDAEGSPSPTGVRQFVVGTGGTYLRAMGETRLTSEVRHNQDHGVIRFLLYPDHYEWQFLTVDGDFSDSGSGECQ